MIIDKIYPHLVTGTRIQVLQTGKIYDIEFHSYRNTYEFIHHNIYQNVLKTPEQVANLIRGKKIEIIQNNYGEAWAPVRDPAKRPY